MIFKEREEVSRNLKKGKLYIAVILWSIILAAIVISYTPLMQIYIINWIVALVFKNMLNVLVLSGLLATVYVIDKKKYMESLKKGQKRDGKKYRR